MSCQPPASAPHPARGGRRKLQRAPSDASCAGAVTRPIRCRRGKPRWRRWTRQAYDLVLSEVALPGVCGLTVLCRARQHGRTDAVRVARRAGDRTPALDRERSRGRRTACRSRSTSIASSRWSPTVSPPERRARAAERGEADGHRPPFLADPHVDRMDVEAEAGERRVETARIGAISVGQQRDAVRGQVARKDRRQLAIARAIVRDLRCQHAVELQRRIEPREVRNDQGRNGRRSPRRWRRRTRAPRAAASTQRRASPPAARR